MDNVSTKLLEEVLGLYGFENAKVEFIRHNENMTYSVEHNEKMYLLRIHSEVEGSDFSFFRGDFSREELITGEIHILNGLCVNDKLKIQCPVKNKDGLYVTRLADGNVATVLAWINDEVLSKIILTDELIYKVGQMAGTLHQSLKLLPYVNRCQYDELYVAKFINETKTAKKSGHISAIQCKKFEKILITMKEVLQSEKDRLILIHGDLGKSNMIYNNDQISPIDFSMCGYGIPEMDLGDLFVNFKNNELILDGYKSVNDCKINNELLSLCISYSLITYIMIHHNRLYKCRIFQNRIDRWCLETFDPLIQQLNI